MCSAKILRPLTIMICAGFVGSLAISTLAADRSVARHRVYSILDRFKQAVTHITLTDVEKPKVDDIFQKAAAQADDIAQHGTGRTQAERDQALGDYARELHQNLSQVLTVGQMETVQLYLGPGPTSRPTIDDFSGNAIWRNLPKALAKLDLSTDKRQLVNDLVESFRQKADDLRAQTANGGRVNSQMQELRQDMKTKLQALLTPDEMQTILQSMAQMRQDQGSTPAQSAKPSVDGAPADEQSDPSAAGGEKSPKPTVDVGSPAPNLKITELNGHAFIPTNYKGHVLVLEFGSMSCPAFREQAPDMEKLRAAEGPRAFFLMVYTREAFPAGSNDVQRNTDQNISIPQATTLMERQSQAQKTQQALQISMTMAVDSMDDAVSNAFGTFPNGAVVIGKDGNVATVEHASDPEALRRAIDQAYEAPGASNH